MQELSPTWRHLRIEGPKFAYNLQPKLPNTLNTNIGLFLVILLLQTLGVKSSSSKPLCLDWEGSRKALFLTLLDSSTHLDGIEILLCILEDKLTMVTVDVEPDTLPGSLFVNISNVTYHF